MKAIESGCKIYTGIKPTIDENIISFDISEHAKRIMEDIVRTSDEWVMQNLPNEILIKLFNEAKKEIKRRKLDNNPDVHTVHIGNIEVK